MKLPFWKNKKNASIASSVNNLHRLGLIISIPAAVLMLAGLVFTVMNTSNAAFTPPTAVAPYGNPSLPTGQSGTPGKLAYWQTANKLGSAADLLWDGTMLTVNKLKLGVGSGAAGKFLKAADNNGTVTWDVVDPTLYQSRLTYPNGATSCPAGQAVSNVDQAGVVTCVVVGSGFDFSISNSTNSVSMQQGSSNVAAGTITVSTLGGVGQVVDFSIDPSTPLPTGVTANFSPTWCANKVSCTTSLTLSATSSASMTPPTTSFKVRGTSGSLSHSTSPVSLTISPGIQFTLMVTGVNQNGSYSSMYSSSANVTLGSWSTSGAYADVYYQLSVLSGPAPTLTLKDQNGNTVPLLTQLNFYSPRAWAKAGNQQGSDKIAFQLYSGSRYGGNFTVTLVATNGTQTINLPVYVYIPGPV